MEETPQMPVKTKSKSKQRLIGAIIMAVIIVVLAGALAFVLVKNHDQNKKIDDLQSQLTKAQNKAKEAEKENNSTANDSNKNSSLTEDSAKYFAIPEWKVKFAIPSGLADANLTYSIANAGANATATISGTGCKSVILFRFPGGISDGLGGFANYSGDIKATDGTVYVVEVPWSDEVYNAPTAPDNPSSTPECQTALDMLSKPIVE